MAIASNGSGENIGNILPQFTSIAEDNCQLFTKRRDWTVSETSPTANQKVPGSIPGLVEG